MMAETATITVQHELTNLVRLAEYFGKNKDFHYKAGLNTVLLCSRNNVNLNYIVSNGSDQNELLKFIGDAKRKCGSFIYIYLSHPKDELLKSLSIDNRIEIFKGATLFIKPQKTDVVQNCRCDFKEDIIDSQLEIVVCIKDGDVVGSMKLFYDGQDMGIYELVIEQEHRMKGFGRDMINYAKTVAFKKGAKLLVVQVKDNIDVFYMKLGFERLEKLLAVKIESIA
jgi:N-acetylglutamate synthase-like GNAT family acetyltransferase